MLIYFSLLFLLEILNEEHSWECHQQTKGRKMPRHRQMIMSRTTVKLSPLKARNSCK